MSATKKAENWTGPRSIIRRWGATYAFVYASAVRSCRGDRDSCVLCSVPSRSLSVKSLGRRKSLASQHRLKVLTVDWPVVALASVLPPMGIGALRFGQESGSPNTNSTLRNATQRQQRKRLQANAMPLWVIRLSAGLLILAHEKIGPPFSGPKLLEVSTS